jgi:hypothetical protein
MTEKRCFGVMLSILEILRQAYATWTFLRYQRISDLKEKEVIDCTSMQTWGKLGEFLQVICLFFHHLIKHTWSKQSHEREFHVMSEQFFQEKKNVRLFLVTSHQSVPVAVIIQSAHRMDDERICQLINRMHQLGSLPTNTQFLEYCPPHPSAFFPNNARLRMLGGHFYWLKFRWLQGFVLSVNDRIPVRESLVLSWMTIYRADNDIHWFNWN